MNRLLQAALAATALFGSCAFAQDNGPVQVSAAIRHDTLPSLRRAAPQADGYQRWHAHDEHRLPLPFVPAGPADGAVQGAARRGPLAPTLQGSVDGVGDGFSGPDGTFTVQYAPPDTVGAVGATQYLQVVNVGLAVFDKTTKAVVYGPVATSTLWSGFGGQCESDNDGDAVVVYDHLADRWIVSQFAVGTTPYLQCVAVSQTSDATGGWYRYAFSYGSVFPDYPKMGVWPDAYYETFNMFSGNSFSGARLCAYDRSAMLTGADATQQCFQLGSSYGGVLPSDLDGPTQPPDSAPNYMVNFGSNSLNLWKFHVDWANSANSTLTGPTNIGVATFTPACGGSNCIPQPGTAEKLDSLGDRLMFRLAYRNFGDHESLVVNHSVTVGTTHKNPYTGVRWYEIRSPGSTPTVYQQSTYAPDTDYRWMGSIAMDGDGNIALGYSVSSSATHPAVRFAGRLAGDALNTLQSETSIIEGSGSQTAGLDRWGDYSAMSVDPEDDCTLWYTTEYLKADGTFNWSTRIGSLKFDGCGASKQSQTVSFTSTAPAPAAFGGTPYTVTATATSGLPVTLTIDAGSTSVCSLSGSTSGSQVSFIGVGTCTIDANQSGNGSYNAAPQVQQTFAVAQAMQTIAFDSTAPAPATAGGATYQVSATASSGLPVTLAIDASATSVCQLDGSSSGSNVSFLGAGTCKIDATQDGDSNYAAALPVQQSFAVIPGPPALLVFTTQPGDVDAGSALATVAVTLEDAVGDVIDDNGSPVDFSVNACGGPLSLGSATTVHGVATLTTTQRFYSIGTGLLVDAASGALTGSSDPFAVLANADLTFADGFEDCRP